MRRVVVAFFLTIILGNVYAQKKNQRLFKMPPNAKYSRGRVLVKVRSEFKNEVANLSGSKATTVKNVSLHAIIPAVSPGLVKSNVIKNGARSQNPVVDISKYYSLTFDANQDVEDYINKLYQTGYFEIVEPDYKYHIDENAPNDPSISKQYYLNLIKAFDAWNITQGDTTIVIAIVDTGGNLTHEDLKANLYTNWKEYPPNGIDDDGNGYIDDYQGWDFIGSDTLNLNDPNFIGDNNPSLTPTSGDSDIGDLGHGTWVAGCASASTNNAKGIAGVGYNTRLLFTKHSADNQLTSDGSEYNVYSGLIYAGYQKDVKIINCSFGGSGQSQIIQDIINHIVLDQNRLIVAAAGNEHSKQPSYPAAYDNVLSAAATDQNDKKASFSNYGTTIDISTPGVGIYTTQYNNTYTPVGIDGTSFSSPITAGAAALVWAKNPSFTAVQVGEQLRVSADGSALYAANPGYVNQLGKGRLDIQRALTLELPSVRASNPKLVNQNGFAPVLGDKAFLSFDFTNYLSSTSGGIQISISTTSTAITLSKTLISPGIIEGGSTVSNKLTPFELSISSTAPLNSVVNLLITYTDGSYTDFQYVSFYVNPSFIDVNSNQVNTTITSIGRIGYQDTAQVQGSGFIFQQNPLLYEMGLIMGTSSTNLYNNVRGINNGYDQDFASTVQIKQIVPGERSYSEIFGEFSNSTTASQQAIMIDYRSLVWKDSPYDKFVILEYELKNPTANALSNFYFGIFSDWDITTDGQNDAAGWDNNNNLGYVYPAQSAAKPYAGIQVLTGSPGYYAIDNDNTIAGNPFGLYDGFTDTEKFTTISATIGSGHERLQAGVLNASGDDVSHVVSSGPLNIAAGQTITIAFALHAAANLADLQNSARYADSVYNYTLKAVVPVGDSVATCYNSSATLNTSGASTLKWYKTFTGGDSFLTGTQFTTGNLTNDTTFYVANADYSYESVRAAVKASVLANPAISKSGSTTLCQGDSITLSVAPSDVILWNTGEITNTIQVTDAGKYAVEVKNNAMNCEAKSDTLLVSVNTKPQANFSISSTDLKIQTPIDFTDQSTDASTWFWDFGDGQNSSIQNPTHTYTAIKTYNIKLSITSSSGCADSKSTSISVITEIEKPEDSQFSVYPNPVSSDYLNIVVPSGSSALTITDILGRQVSETPLTSQETDQKVYVGNLNDGIFIVRVNSDLGPLTKKIIIKR